MNRRLVLPLCMLCVAACGDEQLRLTPDDDLDYFFVVLLDDRDRPVAISDVGRGPNVGAVPTVVPTQDEAESAAVIGFRLSDLEDMSRGFQPERADAMTLSIKAPGDEQGLEYDDGVAFLRTALPENTEYRESDLSGGAERPLPESALTNSLTLRMPVDEEWCRPAEKTNLRPFGVMRELLPYDRALIGVSDVPRSNARRVDDIVRVDRERVLIRTVSFVYLVDRGGDIEHPASLPAPHVAGERFLWVEALTASVTAAQFQPMAAIPSPNADGHREVWLTTQVYRENVSLSLLAHRVVLDDVGLSVTETATIAQFPGVPEAQGNILIDAAVDSMGRLIVVGEPDLVFVQDLGASTFSPGRPLLPAAKRLRMRAVLASSKPSAPHVTIRGDGYAFVGDASGSEPWTGKDLGESNRDVEFSGLAESLDAGERWAHGASGTLLRNREGVDWPAVVPYVPRSLEPCAITLEESAPAFRLETKEVAVTGDRVWLAMERCTAVFVLPRVDPESCTAAITIDGDVPLATRDDDRYFRAHSADGFMTIGTDRGGILEVEIGVD